MSNANQQQPTPQEPAMYDAIIIGAGHNGLICANYLARAGQKVLIVEAAATAGGLAAPRTLEGGFHCSIPHSLPQLQQRIVKDLELERYGFRVAGEPLPTIALSPDGNHLQIRSDSVSGVSAEDQQAYREFTRILKRFAKAIDPFWYKTPPRIGSGEWQDTLALGHFGLNLRMLGKDDMSEFMRMIALPAQDLTDEYFASDLLKSALSWDFLLGNKLAPRSPNNALLNQLLKLSGDLGNRHNNDSYNTGAVTIPAGGMEKLVTALVQSAQHHGVTIRYSSPVKHLVVSDDQIARGVVLEDNSQLSANRIISNADPKTSFLDLLGGRHLQIEFAHRIRRNRNKGMVAKLHLGLNGLPVFTNLPKADGRLLIAPTREYVESAFDQAKYGDFSENLAMELLIPSLHSPELAPPGKHLLSAHIQYLPYEVNGGWEQQKPKALAAILKTLEHYAPGIGELIHSCELLTPMDLEREYRVQGGHWHHTEFCIDQWWMNRPTYGASQYTTPVDGFYLCGAGAHPGGGIMGAAGHNCAKEILKHEK